MSDMEQRYSQIEKEALGIVLACEKFKDYVLGKHISIETDHKPLVPLFSKTDLPPRILRFRLKLSRFIYDIVMSLESYCLQVIRYLEHLLLMLQPIEDVSMKVFVQAVVASLPASQSRLEEYRQDQQNDDVCSQAIIYCQSEWPNRG